MLVRRALLLLIATLSCTHARPKPRPRPVAACAETEPLALLIDGAANLNPGPDGQPLPTVVRVYQLRGTTRWQTANLDEMARNDRAVLADEALDIRELTLMPSGRELPTLTRHPQTTHVAITVLFRRPHGTSWRAVAPLPPPDPLHCYRQPRWIQFYLQEYDALVVPLPPPT
jgi:type VI secretion system protein VasD